MPSVLTKCFNTLPRIPLITTAIQLGVDAGLVRAWTGMLTTLQRHFVVGKAIGPGLFAATGFAEGDSLSVCAMMLTNLVVHRYMQLALPSIHLWSYVDNYDIIAADAASVEDAMTRLIQFVSLLDLI